MHIINTHTVEDAYKPSIMHIINTHTFEDTYKGSKHIYHSERNPFYNYLVTILGGRDHTHLLPNQHLYVAMFHSQR